MTPFPLFSLLVDLGSCLLPRRGAFLAMAALLAFAAAGWGVPPAFAQQEPAAESDTAETPRVVLAIHGGAGTILPDRMTDEQERQYRSALQQALQTGYDVLSEGGSSLDAVTAALTLMEDSPLFNAGKGAVFTSERTVEHDASIMNGQTHQAGAVAGVGRIEHPIELARLVMEESEHVMLVGEGAEAFAREQGVEMVPNETFYTERRRRQIEEALEQQASQDELSGSESAPTEERDASGGPQPPRIAPSDAPGPPSDAPEASGEPLQKKWGTVGAVALDAEGNLAAGTSTGGMTAKRFGRVGDSPVIGAGSYADNATCAVSSTGHGEYFMRYVIAHDIAAMMRYAGADVKTAAETVILEKLTEQGGTGGVIALDAEGNVAMPFNTPGMYRGTADESGAIQVYIFGEEAGGE